MMVVLHGGSATQVEYFCTKWFSWVRHTDRLVDGGLRRHRWLGRTLKPAERLSSDQGAACRFRAPDWARDREVRTEAGWTTSLR
jgi:hypothetical protein